jgi:HK97 family phage major capsid protein
MEMSLEQVTDNVINALVRDGKLDINKAMDTESGKAWIARAVTGAVTEVETKLRSEITAERELRTTAEKDAATLAEKLRHKEQYDRSYGVHRDATGRVRASVNRETEEYLDKLARAWRKKDMNEVRAMSTGTAGGGAEFVPTEVASEVLRLLPETGLYPRIARPWPLLISGKQDIGQILTQMTAYWPDENTPVTASYPVTGKSILEAKQLGAYTELPIALFDDSAVPLGQLVADMLRECTGKELDRVSIVGRSVADGGTDPITGLLHSFGVNKLVMKAGQTKMSQADWTYFSKLTVTAPEGAEDDCSYIVSPTMLNQAMNAIDSYGQPIWRRPADGQPNTIMGRPYHVSYRMPAFSEDATPSTPFVLYGNWSKWAVYGVRKELAIAMSDVAGETFKNAQMAIRALTRVGATSFGPAFAELETSA